MAVLLTFRGLPGSEEVGRLVAERAVREARSAGRAPGGVNGRGEMAPGTVGPPHQAS
ncbi:hypothetical protein RMT89_38010 [Streptomyces sp. P17]|nr:hypothetical protein [Streptomyces sp. P17]